MTNAIQRKCEAVSVDALSWATVLEEPGMKAAPYHELVIPSRAVARLDQLSEKEETSLWDFAAARARHAVQSGKAPRAGLIVNDGPSAGQTVGHIHIHVVGFEKNDASSNIPFELRILTNKFSSVAVPYNPFREHTLPMTQEFVSSLRSLRQQAVSAQDGAGFSLCTEAPAESIAFNGTHSILMECWSAHAPRSFGMTNLLRVRNGYRDLPYVWPAENTQRVFERHPGG